MSPSCLHMTESRIIQALLVLYRVVEVPNIEWIRTYLIACKTVELVHVDTVVF